jgi:GNAT superfamily N-acetyltransferase
MLTDIRPCREADLKLLENHLRSRGRPGPAMGFLQQEEGVATFLVAWCGRIPVGSGQILWQGCLAPEARRRFPGCPELNGLAVWVRTRGVAAALIHTAESHARRRHRTRLGLGVTDEHPRATAFYRRLGYRETGCRYVDRQRYLDADGVRRDVARPARFLVKPLGLTAAD